MTGTPQMISWSASLKLWTTALALGWSAIILGLLSWDWRRIESDSRELARVDARASYDRDISFRRWAAEHGGVYVPVTEQTPPNPKLAHVEERDLVTPSGRHLTLMNSAYISRQVHEWYENTTGTRTRVTSLKPMRPENAPDEWESQALQAFERGEGEVEGETVLEGRPYMRLMRPMRVEPACLKCHSAQGYREGDIRGGVSISVPLEAYQAAASAQVSRMTVGYAGLWLIGALGIGGATMVVRRRAEAQQQADQALRDSEREFRAIFNQSFHLAGVVAPDGAMVDVNTCALEFAGVSLGEVRGRPIWECPWFAHDPLVAERVRTAVELAGGAGISSRFETTHRDFQGRLRTIDFSLRPVKDEGGRVVFLVPEGVDITERKAGEEERARLAEQLLEAQKLESVGRLAGGVAHDFNNMLSPILGYSDLLLGKTAPEHPDRPKLEAISDAAVRARDLTRQLLAFARRQRLDMRPLELNQVVGGFRTMLRHSLRENILLECRLTPEPCVVEGDRGQIEQTLLNLALNAQDAMPGGGTLTITTSRESSAGLPAVVVLTVRDTGTGMDEATLGRIFEPFFTTKEAGKGTGLGLASVYGIVRQHEGTISVDSQPGSGTTFRVTIPASDLPAEEPRKQSAEQLGLAANVGPQPTVVMVVEDNNAVRKLTCGMLEQLGYTVLEAANGTVAQEIAAAPGTRIDLLITDVIMPDVNGKDLYQSLAAGREGLKALFMSGYAADVLGAEEEPGLNFLQKPFSLPTFAAKLREVLGAAQGGEL